MAKKTTTDDTKDVTAEATTIESKVKTLPGGVTQADIDSWKDEHEQVVRIDVFKNSGEKLACYIHEVNNRKLLKSVLRLVGQGEGSAAGEMILKNCWLGGDDKIRNDHKMMASAGISAFEALDLPEASATKLK